MTIPADKMIEPLSQPREKTLGLVDEGGNLTSAGAQLLAQFRDYISGTCRIFPVDIVGQTSLTLTPVKTAPLVKGYYSHDIYLGRAVETSNGLVTATVVPERGDLPVLKVYKQAGAAQATSGDVVADSVYLFVYAEHLDGGNGGLVLK